MRPVLRYSREWLASLACALVVALCLSTADIEVRNGFRAAREAIVGRELTAWATEGESMVDAAARWMRVLLVSHGPLLLFTLACVVLVLMMLRL